MTACVCFCACPDLPTAQRIADAVVDERLAACVNLLPGMRSVYRWRGAVRHDDEILLLIKTTRQRVDALSARIASLHPDELPELIAVEVAGGAQPYLEWLSHSTSPESTLPGSTLQARTLPESTLHESPADHPPRSGA